MVVVVIIGILVAIAIPVYNAVTDNANKRAVEANLRTIDGAIMMRDAAGEGIAIALGDLVDEYLAAEPTGPEGVTDYDIDDGRGIVNIPENTFGTHDEADDATLDDLEDLNGW